MIYYLNEFGRTTLPEQLNYALEGTNWQYGHGFTRRGPDESQGTYFSRFHRINDRNPMEATWRNMPGLDGFWLGVFEDDKPGPEQLRRERQIKGHDVVLGDGNSWHIPCARVWMGEWGALQHINPLPRSMRLDNEGEWVLGEVVQDYRPLWEAGVAAWDAIADRADAARNGDEIPLRNFKDEGKWISTALEVNYRIRQIELSELNLLDEINREEILYAMIDMPTFDAIESKKNTASSSSTCSSGQQDQTLVTVRQ